MRKTLQKIGALLCAAVFVLSVLVVPAAAVPMHEVKPGRCYLVSANVRIDNYAETEGAESGVSLIDRKIGEGGTRSWYGNSSSWTYIAAGFDSGADETSRTISISFGDYGATCKGTAYIKDVVVLETGNCYTGEIEFTGIQASTANGSISGQVIGGGGLWASGVNGFADAWDGNGNTLSAASWWTTAWPSTSPSGRLTATWSTTTRPEPPE